MSEQTRAEDTDSDSGTEEAQRRHASAEKRRARRTSSEESPRRASSGGSKRTSSAKTSSRSPSAKSSVSAEPSRSAKPTESARSADQTTSGAGKRVSAVQAVKHAVEQFQMLTGRSPESVVGTRWEDDHWAVRLEVVESRRIPDTADLLAEYDIELDGQGELLAYSRKDRYVRGRPSE